MEGVWGMLLCEEAGEDKPAVAELTEGVPGVVLVTLVGAPLPPF